MKKLKPLAELVEHNAVGMNWSPKHMFETESALAERILTDIGAKCPAYVVDALCKWVQECGGPR